MKKKILLISAAVIVLAAVCVIGYTLAYFTATDSAENVFTVGNVDITLTEPTWDDDNSLQPGFPVEKDPIVTNSGNNDAYVRIVIELDPTFYDLLQGKGIDLTDILGSLEDPTDPLTFKKGLGTDWELDATISDPAIGYENRWVFNYINEDALETGDVTSALFTYVMLPGTEFDQGDFDGVDVIINVVAQAIQADGFADVTTALAALEAQLNPVNP